MVESIGQIPLLQQRSRVNEENLWEFCLVLARDGGGEAYDGEDVKWTRTPGPLFNRVFAANIREDQVSERIADVVSEFLASGLKASWITGPSTRPIDLGARLEHCGFVHSGGWIAMDAELDQIDFAREQPSGCRVEPVRDADALRVWAETMCAGFGFVPEARQAAHRHLGLVGMGESCALRHYLAYLDDVPAAASTVFYGSRAAGVYFVATIPSARRRGLGAAVTLRGLEDAKQRGYALAILQASRMGEPVYRKMGFQRRCTMGLYVLDPTAGRPLA
jgi:ribosomal protein S18 acetylase RimI-like enzyme